MRSVKRSSEPGIAVAIDRVALIGHMEISDNRCTSRFDCEYSGSSVKWSSRLVKIDCTCHIWRNSRIVATGLRNAIHLNCEENRNAYLSIQVDSIAKPGRDDSQCY